jgi:hypothetical protein
MDAEGNVTRYEYDDSGYQTAMIACRSVTEGGEMYQRMI